VTLTHLRHGDHAVVTHIDAEDPGAAARFAARGIVPGTRIGILRAGDPLLIGIDNDRWAIDEVEAARIHVDLIESPRRASLLRRR
jgi:Fe2+ transport system protein FeoA